MIDDEGGPLIHLCDSENNNARLLHLWQVPPLPRRAIRTDPIVLVSVNRPIAAFSLVSRIPPFRAGIFKAWGSFDPMKFGKSARGIPALYHRLDEPHQVIPRQVAPEQSLLLFHWTNVRVYTGGSLPEPAKHFVEVLHETER